MKRVNIFLSYMQKLYEILEFYKYKFYDGCDNNINDLEKILDIDNFNMLVNSNENTILQSIQYIMINYIKISLEELSDFSIEQKNKLKFLMVTLTDELIIKEITSENLKIWNLLLLEKYFFNTAIAGEKVINLIQEHNEYHSNKNNALSIIFHYIVCAGFVGVFKNNITSLHKLRINTFQTLKNDFNIQDILNMTTIDIHSYEILKGPNYSKIMNYKNIYFHIFLSILILEGLYIFYIIFTYFKIKFHI